MRALSVLSAKLSEFWRERRATAAVEFAMVYPFLIGLLAGVFEIAQAVDTSRRITTAAVTASTMIATTTTGSISYLDMHYAADSTMINFPGVLADSYAKRIGWKSDITVSLAGVTFKPTPSGCTSNCTYTANVVWTGGSATRGCGSTITAVADGGSPAPTTLPKSLYNTVTGPSGTMAPPFAVVVDIVYAWSPLLFSSVIGPITIRRSAYINPRYVTQINYQTIAGDDAYGKQCAGY